LDKGGPSDLTVYHQHPIISLSSSFLYNIINIHESNPATNKYKKSNTIIFYPISIDRI